MSSRPPEWTAFDRSAPPPAPTEEDGGVVVALAATSEAIGRAWAPDVALGIARAWADQGERILLVDAHLGAPVLHEVVRVANSEGLSDALLYGGSVQRSAVAVDDEAFFLVTAGTVVADPATALEPARWARFCAAFREAGVTLVVYVPAEQPWAEAVLAQATDIIYLATPGDSPIERLGRSSQVCAVLGVWGAPLVDEDEETLVDPLDVFPLPAAETREPAPGPAPELTSPVEEVADNADAVPEVEPDGIPAGHAMDSETRVASHRSTGADSEPPGSADPVLVTGPRTKPSMSPGVGRPIWLVGGAAVAAAVMMMLWSSRVADVEQPTDLQNPATAPPLSEVEDAEVVPPSPTPVTGASDYSLAIGSLRSLEDATAYQRRLAADGDSIWFGLAPLLVNGTVFNRVLAGLAVDSLGAEGMKARIASAVDEEGGSWYARAAGLAFLLAEAETRAEATQRAEGFTAEGIPSYVLAVGYSDGSERYRVYAGSYGTEAEATYLRTELSSRALPTQLVGRVGTLPR